LKREGSEKEGAPRFGEKRTPVSQVDSIESGRPFTKASSVGRIEEYRETNVRRSQESEKERPGNWRFAKVRFGREERRKLTKGGLEGEKSTRNDDDDESDRNEREEQSL